MEWLIVIAFLVVCLAVVIVIISYCEKKKKDKFSKLYSLIQQKFPQFAISQKIEDQTEIKVIALDGDAKKICIAYQIGGDFVAKVYRAEEIIACEIIENNSSITRTEKSGSAIGRAALGAVFAGGVGAAIGAFSGGTKTVSENLVSKLAIRVIVDSLEAPSHELNLLPVECARDNNLYKILMGQAQHWHGIFSVLINQEEKNGIL